MLPLYDRLKTLRVCSNYSQKLSMTSVGTFRIRNRKMAYFYFRIRITHTNTERSTVESVGIFRIALRIRTP